jgi:exodeoxyribonuclease III
MKIITWNCNLSFVTKVDRVSEFSADIYVIQECENLPKDFFPGFTFHWVGNNERKGLGILTNGNSDFVADSYNADLTYFLPIMFRDHLVIGVWAFNGRASKFSENASGFFLDALDHYRDLIKKVDKVIIAGDFNNGPQWDKPGNRNNFEVINKSLNELGLYSSYHEITKEKFGKESLATHFHQRNLEKPFHIDYVFSGRDSVLTSGIEDAEKWLDVSDHVPVLAEFRN